MVEEVEALLDKRKATGSSEQESADHHTPKTVFVYCWRGGMRSGAVSWLLSMYGFKVFVLAGGYKAFRNGVLKTFQFPWQLKVLGGYTGSGKTEVLHALKNAGESVIDLEGIAVHKGSAFGNINLPPQPTQEQFENLLATDFNKLDIQQPVWIEDESQRIGSINIPGALWQTIRQSPVYFLNVPFEERLQHIVEEYGQLDKEKVAAAIQRITKRLGGLETKNAIRLLEEDKMSECFSILLKYYDKHYYKSLHNREGLSSLLHEIKCEQAGFANLRYLLNETPA
jgi:tRNA 2-selenouridine synthase